MTHSIVATLSVAAFGLLAARIGDLFRSPFFARKPCDSSHVSRVAWSYESKGEQQSGEWRRVPHPCA